MLPPLSGPADRIADRLLIAGEATGVAKPGLDLCRVIGIVAQRGLNTQAGGKMVMTRAQTCRRRAR